MEGKLFDGERGELLTKVSPFAVRAVRARVSLDASRFDGRETIVLVVATTSLLARSVLDEIRDGVAGRLPRARVLARPQGGALLAHRLTAGQPSPARMVEIVGLYLRQTGRSCY